MLSPYSLAALLLGIYPDVFESYFHTKSCTRMFTAALFMIAKIWKVS